MSAPAQIVIDARKNGVEFRPVDVNYSGWDNLLEERSGKYSCRKWENVENNIKAPKVWMTNDFPIERYAR